MDCPKCTYPCPDGETECPRCGIVFRKYRGRRAAASSPVAEEHAGTGDTARKETRPKRLTLKEVFLPARAEVDLFWFAGRALVFLALAAWSARFVCSTLDSGYAMGTFLHGVNLAFHEAGHILFRPLGRFMTVLGGSLLQLLIPLVCATAFLFKERNPFGASVATWWVAESLMDLAPYIGDARARVLLLLGGVTGRDVPGYHDWEQILGTLGWTRYDRMIAGIAHGTGVALMAVALAWGGWVLAIQARRLTLGDEG